ncbi:hypothetical protein [Stutzerimonas stutzeri]|uniref:hypothetical protein n=1 Tax=Stutzerimonas stutzeri TaxID=316 RepID=UPI000775703C|nr:hypothetical protein [Stutzerimonas stutzeri]KXO83857.1 cupin [Stutzerimonas stutzeri]
MPKCRVFGIDDGLKEVVADGLYMKHLFGQNISVSIVKFVEKVGHDLPAKSHHHGEEASLQIVGECSVFEGQGTPGDPEVKMAQRSAMIIPAELDHYGSNRFGAEGVSMRLNVVTPPRPEFGPEDSVPYYPLKDREARA